MRKLPLLLLPLISSMGFADDVADAEAAAAFAEERPNILFFLTDDQRPDFLGCTGHPVVQTPAIDALAARGVRFDNAFVSTSIGAASRATLFTGLHGRTHRFASGTASLASLHTAASYPALLKRAGYHTGFVGKFGVEVRPGAKGAMFDVFDPLHRNPYHEKLPTGGTRHVTEIVGDRAINFLRGAKLAAAPFCLSVSFNAAHGEDGDKGGQFPYPKSVAGLYDGLAMSPPRDPGSEFLQRSMNRDRFFWRWDNEEEYQANMRDYLRVISGIDAVIGRVLGELAKLGMADDTVVVYMAGNGYYAASHGFAGKWTHYEESQRVPLIVFDPRLPPAARGKVVAAPVSNVDIAPTFLALAGQRAPDGYAGIDLGPLVTGAAGAGSRDDFFCERQTENESVPKWEGVRGQRFKYACYYEQEPPYEFLHDLHEDPSETANLAPDPAYRERLESMRRRCTELGDRYREQAEADARRTLRKAKFSMFEPDGGSGSGATALDEALALDPKSREALLARADNHERAGQLGKALADLDLLVDSHPEVDELLQRRGVTRFFHGDMAGSIADFDAYLQRRPARVPHHWQRGIAYYYAGRFAEGVEQFEVHQGVNSTDVENAVWHFLCVHQERGLAAARRELIPIESDARVPMAEIHALFAGKLEADAVIAAAEAGAPAPDELRNRLCYAHLYLGLYWEAAGDAGKALAHIRKAALDYSMSHYMGEVARVHLRQRGG